MFQKKSWNPTIFFIFQYHHQSYQDLSYFLGLFRSYSSDTIVIYTGYTEEELVKTIPWLQKFGNIIVKFGRFIPNSPHIYDAVLGVELASNNQYAKAY